MGLELPVPTSLPVRDGTTSHDQGTEHRTPGDPLRLYQAGWIQAGYLVRDAESDYLDLQTDDDDAMATLIGASTEASDSSYRLAFGPNVGRKAMTLQTMPSTTTASKTGELVSKQGGFSLHAGVACKATARKKLERLCRYIARPAISEQRLSLASNGQILYQLKTTYEDGTTHVVLSPLEFIGRLAALAPSPQINLTGTPSRASAGSCRNRSN